MYRASFRGQAPLRKFSKRNKPFSDFRIKRIINSRKMSTTTTSNSSTQPRRSLVSVEENIPRRKKSDINKCNLKLIQWSRECFWRADVASEMHQLRDMLHRQEQLLHAMTGLSIVHHHKAGKGGLTGDVLSDAADHRGGDTNGISQIDDDRPGNRKENLSFLLEKVEGVARLLDSSDKTLLKAGEAVLLERDDTVKVCKCFFFFLFFLSFSHWDERVTFVEHIG